MSDLWNRALRAALAPARELEPTDTEVRRVLELDDAQRSDASGKRSGGRRRALRPVMVACTAVVATCGVAYAVPVTRGALDDVYASISGWVGGEGGPGRGLEAGDDAPAWVRESSGDKRLVAWNGQAKLYAVREDDGDISFALGASVGLSDSPDGWRERLHGEKLVLLGPGAFPDSPFDRQDRRPLFGVTARSVSKVELRYQSGPPTIQDDLDGGFALLADAHRKPRELVAYDRQGNVLQRQDISGLELRVCRDVQGCPPGTLEP